MENYAADIYQHGTHQLVECIIGDNNYWINLDVADDYKTPIFHVRVNSDADLEEFSTYVEAYRYFLKRIGISEMK